jgi:hypothetical protein
MHALFARDSSERPIARPIEPCSNIFIVPFITLDSNGQRISLLFDAVELVEFADNSKCTRGREKKLRSSGILSVDAQFMRTLK